MKRLVTILVLASSISSYAQAGQICSETKNDSLVGFDSADTSFDKSITYHGPTIFVDGKYLPMIAGTDSQYSFCKILGKNLVNNHAIQLETPVRAVELGYDDKVAAIGEVKYIFSEVTCR